MMSIGIICESIGGNSASN